MRMYQRSKPFRCRRRTWTANTGYALSAGKLTDGGLCASCFLDSIETLGFVIEVTQPTLAPEAGTLHLRPSRYIGWNPHPHRERQDDLYVA